MKHWSRLAWLLSAAFSVAACGGGGKSSTPSTAPASSTPPGTSTGAPPPTTPPVDPPSTSTSGVDLTLTVTGRGAVRASSPSIDCDASCTSKHAPGTSITFTATPAERAKFDGWGGACSGTGTEATCTVTLQNATSVTAKFIEPPTTTANTCTSVFQYGITFTFDQAYPCGTFANGDYWVTPNSAGGAVKIVSMTPDFTGKQNGWQVNPTDPMTQGFDEKGQEFRAELVPSLPYLARGGQSIVKTASYRAKTQKEQEEQRTFLDAAAVLTVLNETPPDRGVSVFRPPFVGTDKPLVPISRIQLDRLPKLAPVTPKELVPSLAYIKDRYQHAQLDHLSEWSAHLTYPRQNMPFYGAVIAIDNANAVLRLMLNDANEAKRPAAINFVQYGLDVAAARRGGTNWHADGGHRHGRKLLLATTALLLHDDGIAALVHDAPYDTYQEDGHVYFSPVANRVLFGGTCTESEYWYNQKNPGHGQAECRDPYGYIDGGDSAGLSYLQCCTAQSYAADALILRLVPQLRCMWNNDDILALADRWVTFGIWSQPDPYAPKGDGAMDDNPADGVGRWPKNHGTYANKGYYESKFADAMWIEYRNRAPADPNCSRQ